MKNHRTCIAMEFAQIQRNASKKQAFERLKATIRLLKHYIICHLTQKEKKKCFNKQK